MNTKAEPSEMFEWELRVQAFFETYFDAKANDGYEVISGPRTTGDGYYESCVIGIEGNQIEITV